MVVDVSHDGESRLFYVTRTYLWLSRNDKDKPPLVRRGLFGLNMNGVNGRAVRLLHSL